MRWICHRGNLAGVASAPSSIHRGLKVEKRRITNGGMTFFYGDSKSAIANAVDTFLILKGNTFFKQRWKCQKMALIGNALKDVDSQTR